MAHPSRARSSATILAGPRLALFVISVVAALLVVVPTASAATVGVNTYYKTLYYMAGTGETNNVSVSLASGTFTVSDPVANITAQYGGCTVSDAHHVTCPSTYVKWIYVSTSDLDDTVAIQTATPATVNCGTGTDSVTSVVTSSDYLAPSNCESVNAPAAAPPPAPPAPPVLSAPLLIGKTSATMSPAGKVSLPLSCDQAASGDCTGTLVIKLAHSTAGKSDVTASRRGAPNILGRKEISLAKGKKKNVNVSMSSRGRGFVTRHRRVRTTVVIKLQQGGKVSTSSQALTIKAPRKR